MHRSKSVIALLYQEKNSSYNMTELEMEMHSIIKTRPNWTSIEEQTDRVQTVTHMLQTGSPGFSYTHQQLTFYYKHSCILSGSHSEKGL